MACSEPVDIVSREQWGAAKAKSTNPIEGKVKKVIIHHTAVRSPTGLEEGKKQVLSIQGTHMTTRGFDDIGYNFLVAPDGTVFEGRGWRVSGAHTKYHNDDSVGISFMGNFEEEKQTSEAISAAQKLLKIGVDQDHLDRAYDVKGHRDYGTTECPGKNLYADLSKLKSTC